MSNYFTTILWLVFLSHANIEFEAALLRDMTDHAYNALHLASSEDQDRYRAFLDRITTNNTSFPKTMNDIMPTPQDEASYFSLVNAYNNQYGTGSSHHGVVDTSLKPNALLEVTNLSKCP